MTKLKCKNMYITNELLCRVWLLNIFFLAHNKRGANASDGTCLQSNDCHSLLLKITLNLISLRNNSMVFEVLISQEWLYSKLWFGEAAGNSTFFARK